MKLCDQPLRALSSSSSTSALRFVSADDDFSIQAIKKSHSQTLLRLLPEYYKVSYEVLLCTYLSTTCTFLMCTSQNEWIIVTLITNSELANCPHIL